MTATVTRNRLFVLLFLIVALVVTSGCTLQRKIIVTSDFASEPATPKVGEATKLTAKLGGLESYEEVYVDFEMKIKDERKRELVKGKQTSTAFYEGVQTFSKPGTYLIEVHVYTPNDHDTFRSELVVE
ncbi:hypothetical protein [Brevibacillus daliensis]|uniref:hypothetical protein n=1 Tax=Brevibacillus daliensis TaxID=2892995 RepID=UPI001E35AE61|nr:hypothetical protein [Brevibacillus daliensis]